MIKLYDCRNFDYSSFLDLVKADKVPLFKVLIPLKILIPLVQKKNYTLKMWSSEFHEKFDHHNYSVKHNPFWFTNFFLEATGLPYLRN